MLNNDNLDWKCTSAEQLVAYLYNEIGETEKLAFEAHLLDCGSCADEIRGFSNVSFALSEWRRADFESLPMPSFALPNKRETNSEKVSLLDSIRRYLTFSPIWTTAALAVLLVCAGLFWLAADFSPSANIAENKKPTIQNRAEKIQSKDYQAAQPLTVAAAVENENTNVASNNETEKTPDKSFQSPAVRVKNELKKNNPPVKIAVQTETASAKPEQSAAPNTETDESVKTPVKNKVPSLMIDEDDDNALRLSDVLEEVGMNNPNEVKK